MFGVALLLRWLKISCRNKSWNAAGQHNQKFTNFCGYVILFRSLSFWFDYGNYGLFVIHLSLENVSEGSNKANKHKPCLNYAQTYTPLSRIRSVENLWKDYQH